MFLAGSSHEHKLSTSLFGIPFLGPQYISGDFSAKPSGQLYLHSSDQTTFPSCLCPSKFSGLQIAGPSAFSSYTKATQILIRTLRRNTMDWEQSRTSPNRDSWLAMSDDSLGTEPWSSSGNPHTLLSFQKYRVWF